MTPRGLIMTIGTTAIGFAIAIGSAAGFASEDATPTAASNLSASGAITEQAVDRADVEITGMNLAALLGASTPNLTMAERDCVAV